MSSEAVWNKIKDDLAQFCRERRYEPFYPLLEKLQRWSNAQAYSADIIETFITLIRHMSDELAKGHSIQDVLDQTLSGQYVQPDWDVNSVFQTNGNIFQVILGGFRKDVEPETSMPIISVPIILLVMNSTEAGELTEGAIWGAYPEIIRADFDNLQIFLSGNGLDDWIQQYGVTPQVWRPFSNDERAETIEQLINRVLSSIKGYTAIFVPEFIDIRTINYDENRHRLRELRREGCVVIVDSISMRHPTLHREFHRSGLDAYPFTSVVSIAPIHSAFDVLREMALVIQIRTSDMEFTKRRYDDDEDYGICEELCDEHRFRRWFMDRVRKLSGTKAAPQTGIRPYMFNELENTK
jgi:hypothetical protein